MKEYRQDRELDRGKLNLTYSQARAAVAAAIAELPSGKSTVIKNPGRMFDAVGAPLDLVAMALVKAGFDPEVLNEDSYRGYWAREGNARHFRLLGAYCFLYQDLMGAPNGATTVYLGRIAQLMDQGKPAGRAAELAEDHVKRVAARTMPLKSYTVEDLLGLTK